MAAALGLTTRNGSEGCVGMRRFFVFLAGCHGRLLREWKKQEPQAQGGQETNQSPKRDQDVDERLSPVMWSPTPGPT